MKEAQAELEAVQASNKASQKAGVYGSFIFVMVVMTQL